MAFISYRSGNCRRFLLLGIFRQTRCFQLSPLNVFSATCQKIVKFPFSILRLGRRRRGSSCGGRVNAISFRECDTVPFRLGARLLFPAFLLHFLRVHWFRSPRARSNHSLFHPFLITNDMSTSAERHNRVAGRIDLPAPTPPDMRVRIRRFRSD